MSYSETASAGVLDQPLVKLRQFAQIEVLARGHVVAKVRPHVAHREEIIVVVEQEFDLALAAEQALDKSRRRNDLRREIGAAEIEIFVAVGLRAQAEGLGEQKFDLARVLDKAFEQRFARPQLEPFAALAERFLEDVAALDQRMDAPHRRRMRRLGDRGEGGDRDRRSRQVVLDEEQQQVPGRVLFGDRNQLLERLTDPFEKRDDPQEFVFGHPIAVRPACRGSSRSSRPSPPVRRRNLACPVRDSAAAIHRDPSRIRCGADDAAPLLAPRCRRFRE